MSHVHVYVYYIPSYLRYVYVKLHYYILYLKVTRILYIFFECLHSCFHCTSHPSSSCSPCRFNHSAGTATTFPWCLNLTLTLLLSSLYELITTAIVSFGILFFWTVMAFFKTTLSPGTKPPASEIVVNGTLVLVQVLTNLHCIRSPLCVPDFDGPITIPCDPRATNIESF